MSAALSARTEFPFAITKKETPCEVSFTISQFKKDKSG